MRLTDKPLPKGSIAHIWHPDREIEGTLRFSVRSVPFVGFLGRLSLRSHEHGAGGHRSHEWATRRH